mmetsp:Transcript_7665/g.10929  ORF Transcript_7665/g.10929 Transcript_7665/m.10929 type:complete len:180 (-) Transcript_7665:223-762(-)
MMEAKTQGRTKRTVRTVPEKNSTKNGINGYEGALIPYVPVHAQLFQFLSLQNKNKHRSTFHTNLDTTEVKEEEPFPHLVVDIVPTILSYCDGPTVARASCVCREWYQFSQCNTLWENLCKQRFGVSASEIKPSPDPVKRLYIMTYRQFKEACRQNVHVSNVFTGRSIRSLPTIPVTSFR